MAENIGDDADTLFCSTAEFPWVVGSTRNLSGCGRIAGYENSEVLPALLIDRSTEKQKRYNRPRRPIAIDRAY
jgi:hypothetical protein